MAKLRSTEIGDASGLQCAHKPCTKGALKNGSGFSLPFCREHLEALPRALFDQLTESAGGSVYDLDAVADAIALVAEARRVLLPRPKRGKRG